MSYIELRFWEQLAFMYSLEALELGDRELYINRIHAFHNLLPPEQAIQGSKFILHLKKLSEKEREEEYRRLDEIHWALHELLIERDNNVGSIKGSSS